MDKFATIPVRMAALFGTAVILAASPVSVSIKGGLWSFAPAVAHAESGEGEGDGGSGGDGGGHGGDDAGDDHGGSGGHGSDDAAGDDHGRRHGGLGADDADEGVRGAGQGATVVKAERSAGGVEVVFSDGTKVEIDAGRFERKDAAGRTVEERAATRADLERLRGLF